MQIAFLSGYVLLTFVVGSIPFSVLLGNLILGKDIRRYGDGNPGGTNVARAGGKPLGVLAVLLDGLKGALPVGVAYWWLGITGAWMVAIGLVAPLGHAYTPFLAGRGGKAIATTAGVWTGLILWEAPLMLGLLLVTFYYLVAVDGWAALLMILTLLPYLLLRNHFIPVGGAYGAATAPWMIWLWAGHVLLIAWKHRADLRQKPTLRVHVS